MSETIDLIESDSNQNRAVSFDDNQLDLYFKMHQRINSRNEEILKSYKDNILVKFEDIEELHRKIGQSITSLNPKKESITVRVIVSHNEGEAEKFNSFEDFRTHNITSPNPTSEIALLYSFSTYDNQSGEIENYKVLANIKSRIAELNQFEKEAPSFISAAIISGLVTTTARIKVEYSDYVKARHFIAMFDEWIKGRDDTPQAKSIEFLKKISHHISKFGHLTIIALLGYFVSTSMKSSPISGDSIIQFIVIYASLFYIISAISESFLKKLEASIDSYLAISYININKGDSKLIKNFQSRNKKSLTWSIIGVVGTISVGVLTSASYDFIKYIISGN